MKFNLPPQTEPALWGAAGGAAVVAALGFMVLGWMTPGKAASIARAEADRAVATALTPICVDRFRRANGFEDHAVKLAAIDSSWERSTYIAKGGWATFDGSAEPNSTVAQACADIVGVKK